MKKTKKKAIPIFQSEAEEREFWFVNDSTDFVYWKNATRAVFPNLKPSSSKPA
jgi:hypothetical protein